MICGIRARLGGMSEFPLIGESGLENFVHSRGDVRVRFGQLAKVQQDCPKITEIELGVLPPSDIHEPLAHKVECAFERRRKLSVFARGTHQHWQEEEAPPTRVGRGEFEEPGANHTPRGVVISRPNPSGIGPRGRAEAGAVRRHRPFAIVRPHLGRRSYVRQRTDASASPVHLSPCGGRKADHA